eukprot:TRINITY_DN11433_c0_g1_i1.p1 TRINITY_DN11433_c0_g1~~TRINITY_DN11433_c0_g1_i1.p1  ORF type:complete len:276 (+),score=18.56 TRINITY_DN11433_c0_g1_i1:48-875(+)
MAADRSSLPRSRPQTAGSAGSSYRSALKSSFQTQTQRPRPKSATAVAEPLGQSRSVRFSQRCIKKQRPTTAGIMRRCDCGHCWCYKMPGITIPCSGEVGNAHIPFGRTQTPSVASYNIEASDRLMFHGTCSQTFSRAFTSEDPNESKDPGPGPVAPAPKTIGGVIGNSKRINLMYTTGGRPLMTPLCKTVDGSQQSSPGPSDYSSRPSSSRLPIRFPRSGAVFKALPVSAPEPQPPRKKNCSCAPGFAKWKRSEASTSNPFLPQWTSRNAIRIGC